MLTSFAAFGAGLAVILLPAAGLFLRRSVPAEKIFPEQRPRWLILTAWFLLTCTMLVWTGFVLNRDTMALLAAAMTTLASAKFFFMLLIYPDFVSTGRTLWNHSKALTVVMASSCLVGAFMIYVSRLA